MKPTLILFYLMCFTCGLTWSQETHIINWHPGVETDLKITVGDTVKWYVSQEGIVDVSSDMDLSDFGSPKLEGAGSSYKFVFNKPGKLNFYSSTHPKSMRGSIEVREQEFAQEDNFSFKIYPNPVKDRIFFEGENRSRNLDVIIYDVLGKVVTKDKMTTLTIRNGLDVSNLKRGVYLVQIDNGSNSFTQKLVKN